MSIYIEEFKTLFDSKSTIQALRNKVLELAIQGKLVAQDSNDEPASVLLERIKREQAELFGDVKKKKLPLIEQIQYEELPFDIPKSWAWVRLDEICEYIQRGKSPKYSEIEKYPVVAQKCVQWSGVSLDKAQFIDPKTIDKYTKERFLVHGDLLWNSTGTGTCGRIGRFTDSVRRGFEKIVVDSHVTVLRCIREAVSFEYLFLWLSSATVQNGIESKAAGSTNQIELSTSTIKEYVISLAPLAEQHRIVDKVESLMSEIDKLERTLEHKEHLLERLPKAVVDAIGNNKTGEELKENLMFVINHFETVFQTPESMQELRNVILQLAIEGKLVPQDPNDEPALKLVKKIHGERERLVKEGKIKKQKPLEPIGEDEIPFEIPDCWLFSRLNSVIDVRDGTHDTPKYINEGGYPLITGKDFYNGVLSFEKAQLISIDDYLKIIQRSKVDKYDILFSMIGGNIGSMVMVEESYEIAIKNVALFKHYDVNLLLPKYLLIYLKATASVIKKSADGGAQPFVSLSKLRNVIIPLPPIAEQHRIVAKVEAMMTLIDQMEQTLKKKKKIIKMAAETITA